LNDAVDTLFCINSQKLKKRLILKYLHQLNISNPNKKWPNVGDKLRLLDFSSDNQGRVSFMTSPNSQSPFTDKVIESSDLYKSMSKMAKQNKLNPFTTKNMVYGFLYVRKLFNKKIGEVAKKHLSSKYDGHVFEVGNELYASYCYIGKASLGILNRWIEEKRSHCSAANFAIANATDAEKVKKTQLVDSILAADPDRCILIPLYEVNGFKKAVGLQTTTRDEAKCLEELETILIYHFGGQSSFGLNIMP
jgi:hypothetical protein